VRKGNQFAYAVARFLGTEPRALNGKDDRGDLVHPHFTVEVKCPGRGKPLNLSTAMTEAKIEAARAGTARYCVVTRRTGYPIDEALVTMPLWMARQHVPDLDMRGHSDDDERGVPVGEEQPSLWDVHHAPGIVDVHPGLNP
jgi:hypothetical protein